MRKNALIAASATTYATDRKGIVRELDAWLKSHNKAVSLAGVAGVAAAVAGYAVFSVGAAEMREVAQALGAKAWLLTLPEGVSNVWTGLGSQGKPLELSLNYSNAVSHLNDLPGYALQQLGGLTASIGGSIVAAVSLFAGNSAEADTLEATLLQSQQAAFNSIMGELRANGTAPKASECTESAAASLSAARSQPNR